MTRRVLLIAALAASLSGSAGAGVFIGASSTSFPSGIISHPKGYVGSGTTTITNKVCFNPSTLPSGTTEAQVDATIAKAVATWNAQRYGTDNYLVSGNNDLGATQYDFESAVLHEIGHCVGLGHPTIAMGTSGTIANATATRPDASNNYDLDDGADNIFGSRDDLRGDNTNLYWFYISNNDPLAYPSIIDTTTFTQATGSLPSGSTWPANANSNVTAALGYSNARASMTWNLALDEVRRRLTAEDLSTIKLGRAGRDGVAGNSDDYSLALTYDSTVSSCDITVSFSTATSFGECAVNLGQLTGAHYAISSPVISFNPNSGWYFSPATNTTTTITSDSPDPSVVNTAYSVGVSVVRSALLTGTPTGSVLISDGSASCTATLSGSGTTATGSCSLTSTTTGAKTLTASYLGYQGFDASTDTESHTVNLPSASISVTDSPDPTAIGASYNVAFTLSGSFGTPSGTVTVSDGSASCGPVTLASGAGNCNLTSTTGGNKTITASYSGDTNYNASTGSTSHTVNYFTPTLTITDTPDPTTPGTSFTIGATVSGSSSTPTGTVTIDLSDGGGCSISLSGGTGSCSRSSTTVGTLTITGTYEGDSLYSAVVTNVSHSVKYASTTSITSDSPDPSVVGQAYTVGFSVANTTQPATTPTGSVTVSDGAATCTGTLSGGSGSCSLTSTTQGSKSLTATYAGDTNVAGSTSSTAAHTVNAAATTTSISADTPDPSVVGQAVTVTFAVAATSPGSGTPSGTVTISAAGGSETCSATLPATSCTITLASAGSRALTATFTSSNGNFSASTSSSAAHTVNAAATTTSISADTPDPSVVGQAVAVTFAVAATSPGSGTPSGTVTISAATGSETCSATLPATSCNITLNSAGSRALTATFVSSSSNYSGSTSSSAAHTVNAASTTTSISADTPDPSVVGQAVAVTFAVAATSPGSGTPSGTVTISAAGGSETCTSTLPTTSCNLTLTAAGSRALTATFTSSNSNFSGSTSGSVAHTVNAASTTTSISADTPDPSVVGQAVAVTFAVAVASPGSGTPGGSVTISAAGGSETCTASLPATSCNLTLTSAGSRALTATFTSATGNFAGSTSSSVAHTVNAASTTTSISADTPDPSVVGQAVAVTFAVAATSPGSGTPSGTVTISAAGGSETCTATLPATSCNLVLTSAGSRALTATYTSGNGDFATSTSSSVAHTVNAASTTTSITADTPDPSNLGQGVGVTFAVNVTSPGSGTPSGTVTISTADGIETCSATLPATSCNIALMSSGVRALTATFVSSNANFSGSTSVAEPHTVDRRTATLTITDDAPDPSVVGAAYSVAVSLAEASPQQISGTSLPTGTVTVSDGTNTCTITLVNAEGSCNLTGGAPGDVTLTASYGGDTLYGPASDTEVHTVERATPLVTIVSHTPNPSDLLQSYQVTVSVSGNAGLPGGTVKVLDGPDSSDGTSVCFITLAAGGGACSLASSIGGTRTLRAEYQGDAVYSGVAATAEHIVNRGTVTMGVVTTPNPSFVGESYGVVVTFTRPDGADPVYGSVTISDGVTSCTGPVAFASGGCSLVASSAGDKTLTIDFSGSQTYLPATTTATHTVQRYATATTIVSDTPDPSTVGAAYLVTVDVDATLDPDGTVTVSDGVSQCIATVTAGSGSCSLVADGEGLRTLTATFAQTATHASSVGTATHTAIVTDRIFRGRFE